MDILNINPAVADAPPSEAGLAETFGRRLRYERERQELTLSDLSRAAGFAQGRGKNSRREVICRYERGDTVPLLSTAKRLAEALGITLDELVTEPPPDTTVPEWKPPPAEPRWDA